MTPKVTMTISIAEELKRRIDAAARECDVSRSDFVTRILGASLDSAPGKSESGIREILRLRGALRHVSRIAGASVEGGEAG